MLFTVANLTTLGTRAETATDPFAEPKGKSEAPKLPPEPDHLVPVDPYPGDWHVRYTDLIRAKLKLDEPYFARMVVKPSFGGESSLRLHGGEQEHEISKTEKVFLTHSVAEKSIWYSMPENNQEKQQKEVKVTTTTVSIPKPMEVRLCSLWNRMILRTRVPAGNGDGLDGVTIEFATRRGYGETWSPMQQKSPLLFVELGESLVDYCKSTDETRKARLKAVSQKADKLESYLDAHKP